MRLLLSLAGPNYDFYVVSHKLRGQAIGGWGRILQAVLMQGMLSIAGSYAV